MSNPPIVFLTPQTPSTTLALTTVSATAALATRHNFGVALMVYNSGPYAAYFQFGATADPATGYAISAGDHAGPFMIPDGETQVSGIASIGTATMRFTRVLRGW